MTKHLSLEVSLFNDESNVAAFDRLTSELSSYIGNMNGFCSNLQAISARSNYPEQLYCFRAKIIENALCYRNVHLPAVKNSLSKLWNFLDNFEVDIITFESNLQIIIEDLVSCSDEVSSTAVGHTKLYVKLVDLQTEAEITKNEAELSMSTHQESESKAEKKAAECKEYAGIAESVGTHFASLGTKLLHHQCSNGTSYFGIAVIATSALITGATIYFRASYLNQAARSEKEEIASRLMKEDTLKVCNELNGATGNSINNLCQIILSFSTYLNIVSSNTKQILESAQRSNCDHRRLRLEHAKILPQAKALAALCREFMGIEPIVQTRLKFLDTFH